MTIFCIKTMLLSQRPDGWLPGAGGGEAGGADLRAHTRGYE